ncbi:hypothetical protein UNDKW_5980 (plasmid) [Undibacterium sp. KW1]|uniref:hypothetical protein n=1 Tax=Undibacterium sp. KW1 TaxID=2058624 RepID=UPI001331CDF2|nr:hypothetical protein [Undibacterium sp. KW1]BBB64253.1 hypothetical protein UNDKW_5980 [Undibacterium sp. KW1]
MTEPMPEIDETAAPAPFFALSKLDNAPASSLDGTSGINRATLTPWITASNDSEAIKAWLHMGKCRIRIIIAGYAELHEDLFMTLITLATVLPEYAKRQ